MWRGKTSFMGPNLLSKVKVCGFCTCKLDVVREHGHTCEILTRFASFNLASSITTV